MSMRVCLSLIVILSISACSTGGDRAKVRIDKYFDLVSLLDEQTEMLFQSGKSLEKKLTANGDTESIRMRPDSAAQLKQELELFYEADINKLGLGDAYFTEELPGINGSRKVINTAKSAGPKVRLIEYDYKANMLDQIRIIVEDKNDVYSFEKEMLIHFKPVEGRALLSDYLIKGKQHMVMKSDLDFTIEGRFLK